MGWSSLAGRLRLIGRASRQNSFLQTLYEINKLILRANEARTLLEQACHLLVTGRDYPLVWIGLVKDGEMTIKPCAQASALDKADKESPHFFRLGEAELGDNPIGQALHTGMMILSPDLARERIIMPI